MKNANLNLLIPQYGGYKKLKTYQLAKLVYDVTVRFCDRYISKYSRTHDQMVQAARSGVQNIAEGSLASGTSKKTEIKLTNVAYASLGELHEDYCDFLRQKKLTQWERNDPRRNHLIAQRCQTADNVALWVKQQQSTQSTESTKSSSYPEASANAAITLINVTTELLSRQINTLANHFLENGGFTERLYKMRSQTR